MKGEKCFRRDWASGGVWSSRGRKAVSALTPCPKGLGMVPLGLERGLGLSQITPFYSWRQLLLGEEFISCVQISEPLPCFRIWAVGEEGRN